MLPQAAVVGMTAQSKPAGKGKFVRRVMCVVVSLLLIPAGAANLRISAADAASPAQDRVVRTTPLANSPHVVDGRVYAFAQVGNKMIVGGVFTAIKQTKTSATIAQANLFAFDATTGVIDAGFRPVVNDEVFGLEAGANGASVYVGGRFTKINGVTAQKVALLNTATGTAVPGFTPPYIDGPVNDFSFVGTRLFIGGQFSRVGATAHSGLAALKPATGAVLPYMNVQTAGHHNYVGAPGQIAAQVGVKSFDVSADGKRLVAIGNFKTVDGLDRDQLVVLNLGATSASVDPNWQTNFLKPSCSSALDFYARDVSISPDGSYFVVAAYGGPNGLACDVAVRFETNAVGQNLQPTWMDHTGGDSLWSVAVTGTAVYVGGHQRWMNKGNTSDFNATPGSVGRAGIAALDPVNGLPLSWNPGRNPRGVGTFELFATPTGLWVGSDTDYFGNWQIYRGKLAFFPLAGGSVIPPNSIRNLPGKIFQGGKIPCTGCGAGNDVSYRSYDGTTFGASTTVADGGVAWSLVRGAVLINGTLFFGHADGNFYKRSFDGTTFGAPALVDPYNDPYWSNVRTGVAPPQTYRGNPPTFYGTEATQVSGMFFTAGRLYYTRMDTGGLYYRYFTPESGVLGVSEFQVPGLPTDVAGMFLAGSNLYYGTRSTGNLYRIAFGNGAPVGAAVVLSGPAIDGRDWRANSMFLR